MSENFIGEKECEVRMSQTETLLKEVRADIKTLLARTNEYGGQAIALKDSVDLLWQKHNNHVENHFRKSDLDDIKIDLAQHKSGHWKWISLFIGILTVISMMMTFFLMFKK